MYRNWGVIIGNSHWGGIIGYNAMCGWGYYTVGNKAMYVQFKGIKGLETVALRKVFKIVAENFVFHPFPNKTCLSGTLSVHAEIHV